MKAKLYRIKRRSEEKRPAALNQLPSETSGTWISADRG